MRPLSKGIVLGIISGEIKMEREGFEPSKA